MIIAIAAGENKPDAKISPHFGKSKWYCLYDTEKDEHRFVENNFKHDKESLCCEIVQYMSDNGVSMVVAVRFGAKAIHLFRQCDIQIVMPPEQKNINEIINQLKL